jgi:hypothetical protein
MRSIARASALAAAIAAVLGSVASAQAATVTVGSPLGEPAESLCLASGGCTYALLALPEPGAIARSPVDGLIVGWRIKGAKAVPGYALRVIRRVAGPEFLAAGTSDPVTPAGAEFEAFGAHLAIHEGDFVGVNIPSGGGIAYRSAQGTYAFFSPSIADGTTEMALELAGEVGFNAVIEPAPSVTLIGPSSGPTGGGTSVTVAGSDFTSVTAVRFGALPAPSFEVDSEAKITAVSPAATSSGPVDVTVTTEAGTSVPDPGDRFEYQAPATGPGCVVPNLEGKKLKAAKARARKADCVVGKVRKAKGANASTGKVVGQSPKPGKAAAGGTRISVKLR